MRVMSLVIRKVERRDAPHWLRLWGGYLNFYETELPEEVTSATWARLLDPQSSVFGIVAELDGEIVGIANCVVHESTWESSPICYLEDLFVDPRRRAAGVGQRLIDWLVAEMHARGWSRLYWHTRENNYRARGLYDKYTPHSGFVRYVVEP